MADPDSGPRERLLSLFERSSEPYTTAEVAERFDVDRARAGSLLARLAERGRLETKDLDGDIRLWWCPSPASGASEADPVGVSSLEAVVDDIGVGVAVFDAERRLTYANDAARTLLDCSGSSVVGRDVREVAAVSDRFVDALATALDGGESVVVEPGPGSHEWVEYAVSPADPGAVVVLRDVSERKRLEGELRTEREQFRTALQNSPLVAFRLDTDLRYTWVGNPHEDFDQSTVLGKRDDELLPPAAAEIITAPKRRVLETGEGVREEVTYDLPSGEVTYDLTVEPLRDETGELVGVTSAALDITERKRRERTLREQNERLDRFTEVLSHDLRSPLSVAMGRLSLFERDPNPEHLDAARRSLERISTLIDDVLAAARQHTAAAETTDCSLGLVARRAWTQVETDEATLVVDADHTVEANESRLQQLFENLFTNAVEHGVDDADGDEDGDDVDARDDGEDDGGDDTEADNSKALTVRVGTLPGDEGEGEGEGFYVEDDGIGLPLSPPETDRVFEDGYSTTAEGTGLGLGIVRDVVSMHGWSVTATTAESGGARFEFRLD